MKNHEGLRLKAYDDKQPNKNITSQSQVLGKLTIGYGHTGADVYVGQTISETTAERLLVQDLNSFNKNVSKKVTVQLTQNMFDALVSFSYNVGNGNFNSSTLLKLLNQAKYNDAANQFDQWRKSGGQIMQGLVLRRADEKELFLEGLGVHKYYNPSGEPSNLIADVAKLAVGVILLS